MYLSFNDSGNSNFPHAGSNLNVLFDSWQEKTWDNGDVSYTMNFTKEVNGNVRTWWYRIPQVYAVNQAGEPNPVGRVRQDLQGLAYTVRNLMSEFCGCSKEESSTTVQDIWNSYNSQFRNCVVGKGKESAVSNVELFEQTVKALRQDLIETLKACVIGHEGLEGTLLLHYGKQYLEIPKFHYLTQTDSTDGETSQSFFLRGNKTHTLEGTRLTTINPKKEVSQEVESVPTEDAPW